MPAAAFRTHQCSLPWRCPPYESSVALISQCGSVSQQCFPCVSSPDLAPGNDEIYEEKQENFLTAGNPQDGQVVLYKVGRSLLW